MGAERNLFFGSADLSGAGKRDETLRTSAWKATQSEANVCRHECNLKKPRLSIAQNTQQKIRGCVLVPRTQ